MEMARPLSGDGKQQRWRVHGSWVMALVKDGTTQKKGHALAGGGGASLPLASDNTNLL
jgi:hypothetical protein